MSKRPWPADVDLLYYMLVVRAADRVFRLPSEQRAYTIEAAGRRAARKHASMNDAAIVAVFAK